MTPAVGMRYVASPGAPQSGVGAGLAGMVTAVGAAAGREAAAPPAGGAPHPPRLLQALAVEGRVGTGGGVQHAQDSRISGDRNRRDGDAMQAYRVRAICLSVCPPVERGEPGAPGLAGTISRLWGGG